MGITRAVAPRSEIVALDESGPACDVSIGAGIINLLRHLQDRFRLSYLIVSPDFSAIKHRTHRVAVMLGRQDRRAR